MTARSDADAIAASLLDPKQFALVFDRHAATVFRFLVRRVGRDPAEDLLGETFRVAFEARASYDVAYDNARPWLYGIATNLVSKHQRGRARAQRAQSRLPTADTATCPFDASDAALDATVLWPQVVTAVHQLPADQFDVLLLHVWEELSYEEIAVALAIPVGTVRSRLSRARTRLRDTLQHPTTWPAAISTPEELAR